MALIKCQECGKEISDTSKKCIHCGAKIKKEKNEEIKKNKKKTILIILSVFLFIGIILTISFFLKSDVGLAADGTDVTLKDVAKYCDVFYIGGTKVGALCGEAVVFTKANMPPHFMTMVKQRGALLAKGRLLGIQFDALFTDGLYFEIGRNAIVTADRLKRILKEKGYEFYIKSPTNQIFVVLENRKLEQLKREVAVSFWEKKDEDHTVIRFATSWATRMEDVEKLAAFL